MSSRNWMACEPLWSVGVKAETLTECVQVPALMSLSSPFKGEQSVLKRRSELLACNRTNDLMTSVPVGCGAVCTKSAPLIVPEDPAVVRSTSIAYAMDPARKLAETRNRAAIRARVSIRGLQSRCRSKFGTGHGPNSG